MKRLAFLLLPVCLFICAAPRAYADTTYNISFSDSFGPSGSGSFAVDSLGNVTAFDAQVLIGLPFSLNDYDFVGAATDGSGLTYGGRDDIAGLANLTLSAPSGSYSGTYIVDFFGTIDSGDFNVTGATTASATPEPSSIALLGTGALGTLGFVRRRIRA